MNGPIYLDHNATTPTLPEAWEAMRHAHESAGNPSSSHRSGRLARRVLEDARERVAARLCCHPDEVIFTSGATEANNLALFGLADAFAAAPVEHPCVIEPLRQLAGRGRDVTWLPVNAEGFIDPNTVPADRLVSVMLVNHETGAIQPVREVAARCRMTHTDAAQAVGKIGVDFRELGVTALSASAHKFGGPMGVGVLIVKRDVPLRPLLFGGHQQQDRRPGTEAFPLAAGMAAALDVACERMAANRTAVEGLRELFLGRLEAGCPPCVANGPTDPDRLLPHTLNVSFPGCRADVLLMKLDLAGVACSTGSACSSGSLLPSPVLRAMGVPDEVLRSAMRFSFAPSQTPDEIAEAAGRVVAAVRELRDNP